MFVCSKPHYFVATGARLRKFSTLTACLRSTERAGMVLECKDAFEYSSGRWLYNEPKRLAERYLSFDIPALVKAAALSVGRNDTDVQSIRKLAEGGFNRIFELTMKDGFQLIARLPYPSVQPKRLAVASEVATMDLVRSLGIPVPEVYDYSPHTENSVGAEYIFMEKVRGRLLGDVWFTLSDSERVKILSGIVDYEAKLFAVDLPAYGSVFYDHDLPRNMQRQQFQPKGGGRPFCIGPDASLKFWFEERSALEISRGFSMTPTEVLQGVAVKEMAWLRSYSNPRLPFDRVYRDITNYQKSNPQEHLRLLEQYLQVSPGLVPKDKEQHRAVIRHPDLNPNNIFISESYDIVSIIDWQHSTVLPLFLHAGIPAYLQNYGDPVSESLVQPQLPAELEDMDDEDRQKEIELYRRRHLHFYYVGATAKKNDRHFQAMMYDGGLFRRKIFQHAGIPWEGNSIPLKADLIRLAQHWEELTSCESESHGSGARCPISFDEREAEETLEGMMKQEEADSQMETLRNAIGINVDGWVSQEGYERAVADAAEMKLQAVEFAEDDFERDMTVKHWPFDDFDEKE